jgi:hypothetical protein
MLEDAGVTGSVWDDLSRLSSTYVAHQRQELTFGHNLTALILDAVIDLASDVSEWVSRTPVPGDRMTGVTLMTGTGVYGPLLKNTLHLKFTPGDDQVVRLRIRPLATAIQNALRGEPTGGPPQYDPHGYPRDEVVGLHLLHMRLGASHRDRTSRWREVSPPALLEVLRRYRTQDQQDSHNAAATPGCLRPRPTR